MCLYNECHLFYAPQTYRGQDAREEGWSPNLPPQARTAPMPVMREIEESDMADMPHDLNFLYLVDALYREGSVSAAARRLDLTQPAASHALNRLRARFGDPLFVRSGAGMTPTPTGERMARGAARALALIRSDVLEEPRFDPGQSERRFTVGMTDMGGTA